MAGKKCMKSPIQNLQKLLFLLINMHVCDGVIVVAIKSLLSFSEYDASSSRSKSRLHLLTGSIPVCVGVQFTVQDIELVSIVGFPVAPRAGRWARDPAEVFWATSVRLADEKAATGAMITVTLDREVIRGFGLDASPWRRDQLADREPVQFIGSPCVKKQFFLTDAVFVQRDSSLGNWTVIIYNYWSN